MKCIMLLFAIVVVIIAPSVAGEGVRYRDSVFSEVTYTPDIHYSSAPSVKGFSAYLTLDIYEPLDDTARNRPLILLIHSGSFISGAAHDGTLRSLCLTFAKKGYVCSSINYRVGIPDTTASLDYVKALYRVVEDARSAVRYIAGQQELRIDPKRVIVGGNSAGAIAALHYAYMNDSAMNARIGDTSGIRDTGNVGPTPTAAAVLNMWGALLDLSWIRPGGPPIISFHGTADSTVPFRCGRTLSVQDLIMCGSGSIDSLARIQGIQSELYSRDTGHIEFEVKFMTPLMTDFLYRTIIGNSGIISRTPLPGLPRHQSLQPALYIKKRTLPSGYHTELRGRRKNTAGPGIQLDIR